MSAKSIIGLDRRAIVNQGIQMAASTRAKLNLGQAKPVCVFQVCESLGITVRFNDINMEGMYQKSARPKVHLSALRPLTRRVFNCAHELGHHLFEHGSSIDELRENAKSNSWEDPKEFLVDSFAGFFLMPTIGIRRAFSVRNIDPETATAVQLYTVACEFGVGYATLLTHLSCGLRLLKSSQSELLQRLTPQKLRERILDAPAPEPLVVVDRYCSAHTVDTEVGSLVLLPTSVEVEGKGLTHERDTPNGRLFRASQAGVLRAVSSQNQWSAFIRIAPKAYVGLARYRHFGIEQDD